MTLAAAPVATHARDPGGDPGSGKKATTAVYLVFFTAYTTFAVGVLAMGLAAKIAGSDTGLHDGLHEWALVDSTWGRLSQRMADAAHRSESLPAAALDYGFSAFNLALALVLVWLRRHERTARLLAIGMVGTATIFNLQAQAVYEILPPDTFERGAHDVFQVVASLSYFAALVLFPDGMLVPRWPWRRLVALYAAAAAVVIGVLWLASGSGLTIGLVMAFGVLTPLVGVGAQVYRHRSATAPLARQQARLLGWALAPALVVGLFAVVYGLANASGPEFEGRDLFDLPVAIFRVFQPVFGVIPIALFVGILRYRLWDIDRLISRTIAYSVLAGFVSLVYVGVVVGMGALVGGADVENLGLSLVATGIVALGFQPVKERVTLLANYLVFGKRATPYEVLAQFTQRVSDTPGSEDVMARMAQVLGEGTGARRADVWLRIGGELRAAATWPDAAEEPPRLRLLGDEVPPMPLATATAPVRHQGELFGALSVTKAPNEALTAAEAKLLEDLAHQAGLVLRNVQLTADLVERLEELRASRQRLVAAQDETRRRLERNLHDGAQQQLVALRVHLALIEGMLADIGDSGQPIAAMVATVKEQLGDAIEELRDLARGIFPPLLAAEGLAAALSSQARKLTVPVDVQAEGLGRYGQEVESAVYFCVLEALQNVQKYAAASNVVVRVAEREGRIEFEVRDDGAGFDVGRTAVGSGTVNMRDRLEAVGGSFEIRSSPGQGTRVRGTAPVAVA